MIAIAGAEEPEFRAIHRGQRFSRPQGRQPAPPTASARLDAVPDIL